MNAKQTKEHKQRKQVQSLNEKAIDKIAVTLYEKLQQHMIYLYWRWQDEQEMEDIKDYSVNIEKEVKAVGGTFLKMNKRPFGFTFKLSSMTYQVMVTGNQYDMVAKNSAEGKKS